MKGIVNTINVSATLKALSIGESVFLPASVNENTLRHACVRLKAQGSWSVNKMRNPDGFTVIRNS